MRIINAMFGCGLGGIEQAFLDYNTALIQAGHDVAAIIHPKARIRAILDEKKMPYTTLPNWGYWDIVAIGRLHKLLQIHKPDIIITHGNRAVWLLRKAAQKEFPVVGVCHNYRLKRLIGADALFSITEDLCKTSTQAGQPAESVYIIPNMIDTSQHQATPSREQHLPPVIGTMGRFVHKKGFHTFLDALKLLKDKGILFKAILGGNGEGNEALQQLAKNYDLQDRVAFPGWITDKAAFFEDCDVFCLPSLHEPFGIVLLEAFLHETAVVSTATEGPREIITDKENGRLIPPNDAKAMAEVLEDFLQNPSRANAYAKNGLDTVKTRYAMPVVGDKIEKALEHIIAKHKQSYQSKAV